LDGDLGDNTSLPNVVDQAVACAKKYNSVILLKGSVDVIADPDGQFKLNRTGVPAMTVGGTGDVLTGIVAALLAIDEPAFRAAAAAAFISGVAGEMAFDERGVERWLLMNEATILSQQTALRTFIAYLICDRTTYPTIE
jgi:NAD(P)H-hydrate repair Nnr-like enzyme with NAD(P)H-hydrate dehydratase domain